MAVLPLAASYGHLPAVVGGCIVVVAVDNPVGAGTPPEAVDRPPEAVDRHPVVVDRPLGVEGMHPVVVDTHLGVVDTHLGHNPDLVGGRDRGQTHLLHFVHMGELTFLFGRFLSFSLL